MMNTRDKVSTIYKYVVMIQGYIIYRPMSGADAGFSKRGGGLQFKSECAVVCLTLEALKYFCLNHGDQRVFSQFETIINVLALSDSVE